MTNIKHLICNIFPHRHTIIKDDGNYVYKECKRCGYRCVEIFKLNKQMPNYDWVDGKSDKP